MTIRELQRGDVLHIENKHINITATVKQIETDRISFFGINGSFIFSFEYLNKCKVELIDD